MATTPKLITEDDLQNDPKLAEAGLNVGDAFPAPEKKIVLKEGQVAVDVVMLQNILDEVKALRGVSEEVTQLKKDNEMLLAVADKGRIVNYQTKNNPQGLVRTARAWVFNGKLVKATITLKNQVFTDVNGRVFTDQVLTVYFEDGTNDEMPYDKFMKEKEDREGDIIKREVNDENGQTFYTLKFKDGKEFSVNYLFIN